MTTQPTVRLATLACLVAICACAEKPAANNSTLAALRQERNDYYTAEKACPFECCGYGNWTFLKPTRLLRHAPGDDSIGFIAAGQTVHVDSGFVSLRPTGMAIVTNMRTLTFDKPAEKPPIKVGDTLYLLDYLGEGYRNVRWRDTLTFAMSAQWDSTGRGGARVIRPPNATWWVHVAGKNQSGWVLMAPPVEVRGADRCG